MYTLTDLCKELSITPATGRNWVKLGKIKPTGKRGRSFTFSDDYVRSLKEDLESGKMKSLRSRRNKSHVSGNLLYSSYIANSSPNFAIVQKLVMDVAGLEKSATALDAATENDGQDDYIGAILLQCAKKLIASRVSEEDRGEYDILLNDICAGESKSDCNQLYESNLSAENVENSPHLLEENHVTEKRQNGCQQQEENPSADNRQNLKFKNFADGLTYIPGEDTLGFVYISLKHLQTRKSIGAYYTPGNIVQRLLGHLFEANVLADGQDKVILDPGCGSGNFLLCLPPGIPAKNIYGFDIDEMSVKLARLNLALKYKLPDANFWKEHITTTNFLHMDPSEKTFDIILGNPPWGSTFPDEERKFLKERFLVASEKSLDSYDLFIEQGLNLLKSGGALSLVLPESVLLVKSHTVSRRLLIENSTLTHLEYLGDVFDHVQCPSIILQAEKISGEVAEFDETDEAKTKLIETKEAKENREVKENRDTKEPGKIIYSNFLGGHPVIYDKDTSYRINSVRKISDTGFDFLMPDEEYELLEYLTKLEDVCFLKGNADFALGIVTGANKDMLKSRKSPTNEIILKGTDIFRYSFKKPKCYITFEPEKYQQVAPVPMYRAPQKLLYRFIGGHLVFAYDDEQTLSLNSCNIVIPNIENLSMKYILAVLNSSVSEYYFRKKFRSVKVLRSHIESLPIPLANMETQERIIELVDELMLLSRNENMTKAESEAAGEKAEKIYGQIDEMCFDLFKLTPEKTELIKQSINNENLLLSL
ncbi:TaqI-like C-terminal specificity domain-containing protein [Butyrivibrio sp. JL13D10]|uniref:TaqI-like C-terminal specificity domain-containing protein n=1 Tax=Butyrivibrio sp. JL13D10 TaxID=3236815 RepID=UPI0038B5C7EF